MFYQLYFCSVFSSGWRKQCIFKEEEIIVFYFENKPLLILPGTDIFPFFCICSMCLLHFLELYVMFFNTKFSLNIVPVKCDSEELLKYHLTCVQTSIFPKSSKGVHTLKRSCVLRLVVAVRNILKKLKIWRGALVSGFFAVMAW